MCLLELTDADFMHHPSLFWPQVMLESTLLACVILADQQAHAMAVFSEDFRRQIPEGGQCNSLCYIL